MSEQLPDPSKPPLPAPPRRGAGRELAVALVVVLLAITAFWFGPASQVAERRKQQDLEREAATESLLSPAGRAAGRVLAPRPLRLAVLALPQSGPDGGSDLQPLLQALAADFATIEASRLGVVGPLQGGQLSEGRTVAQIGAQLGVDYVLEIEVDEEGGTAARLHAMPEDELAFSTRFPAATPWDAMTSPIAAGCIAAIEQAREVILR